MESNGKYRLQVLVLPEIVTKLDLLAKQYGVSRGAMISVLIEQECQRRKEGGG